MISFLELAQRYAIYHQKPMTRHVQMIDIPLIFLAIMILLSCVHVIIPGILDINFACIVALGLLVYYFRLNWHLALVVTPLFIALLWVAGIFSYPHPTYFTLYTFLIVVSIGCLLLFASYFMEGKRPSLTQAGQQILIAPLMMAADLLFLAGWLHDLKVQIYGQETTHIHH